MCNQEGTSGHEARRSGAEHPLGWLCGSSMLGNFCGTAAKVRGRQILCSDMGIRHQLDARKQEVASDRVAAAYACRTRTKCLNEVGLLSCGAAPAVAPLLLLAGEANHAFMRDYQTRCVHDCITAVAQ